MKHIEINIGKACNNKCRFCMSSNSALWDIKFVSFEKLKKKLKQYYLEGYDSVGFLGGDISIYPNIKELFSYCKKLGFVEIHAVTNSMVFADYNFAKKVVQAGLTRINISIHSHNEIIEDYLTGIPGGLNKKIKAINNFNKLFKIGLLKSNVSVNLVLNALNYKTILETVLFFNKILNINDIRINFIWLDDMIKNNWEELKVSYDEFLPYFKKIIYISLKYNIRITFDTIPICIFFKIDNNNYRKLIEKFLGEELDHIVEIDWTNNNTNFNWQDKKKNQLKTQFQKCKKCIYRDRCQGVWKEYGEIYGDKEFIPIK